jgi:hypothetical protein
VIASTPTYISKSGAIIMGALAYAMNGVAVSGSVHARLRDA